jgi:signal transduction histidine kinase
MWWNRESGVYGITCLAALIIGELLCMFFDTGLSAVIILLVAVLIIFAAGLFLMSGVYRKVRHVRNETENLIYADKRKIPGANETDKTSYLSSERYMEGELGKLSNSVAELYSMLAEAEQKQLREKEFMRDIISDISHQLKTPIATLTVYNDIFSGDDGTMPDEQRHKMLKQSEQQLERMKWLIQAMLQLARIEAESITFKAEGVNAKALLESSGNMLKIKADEKKLDFIYECDENITFDCDREWMQEALVNVIKNAVEYAPCGSSIILGARQTPIATKLYVRDSGLGIAEKDRINVFKRFYRAGGNEVNPNSVGIGLALSKSIVEGCGGRIMVESRHISECTNGEKSYTEMVMMF